MQLKISFGNHSCHKISAFTSPLLIDIKSFTKALFLQYWNLVVTLAIIQECFLHDKMEINDWDKNIMGNHIARIPQHLVLVDRSEKAHGNY